MKHISYVENALEWEKGFIFFIPVKVRFSETDMFGHLNNKVPFTYFEEARIEFFGELGFKQKWMDKETEAILVVANQQCDYVKQVYFDEQLQVYVKVHSVGTSSADLHYMVKNEAGEICLAARGTIVQISKTTGKGLPWSDKWKAKLLER